VCPSDQHNIRLEGSALIARRPLGLRIFQALAQHVQQIKVLALDPRVVQMLKSLSWLALLAVSQRCAIRSNFSGRSLGA
jgi:hypothetical protein